MNLAELRTELADLLNFNAGQTDQDYTTAQLNRSLNRAKRREYNRARQEGDMTYFMTTQQLTWPASQLTYTLGPSLVQENLIRLADITESDPGYALIFDRTGYAGDVYWRDRNTLQWGTAGPSSARTLRFEFYPEPTDMVNDADEPDVILRAHHELLFWSAAVDLRSRADEAPPQAWVYELRHLQMDFYKDLSRRRPHSDTQTIGRNANDDAGIVY